MREMFDRFCVVIAIPAIVVFDGQIQPALHELDIPFDRPGRHLEVFGNEWAIGKLFGPDPLMHEEHPFQRRSGKFDRRLTLPPVHLHQCLYSICNFEIDIDHPPNDCYIHFCTYSIKLCLGN